MRISVPRRISRSLRVLILAGVAIPIAASSALAAHQDSQTGSIGHVAFTDSSASPGARCTYQGAAGSLYFSGIVVKGPRVQWPDQNSSVTEHGWVVERIRIGHYDGTSWTAVKQSTPKKLAASDNAWTQFPTLSLGWDGPNSHVYRASVSLKWVHSNGTVEGRAVYVIDNHRRGYDNSVGAACVGRHPNLG